MRIQHNIMAMNAYRNYNLNNKALSGNLEKLSSGYKINRAGDDAAGLAISEKMRAQITGLNAASKNVKDGISLVKTAEGAMQEIQDMLNRMDYLATQSANGTYDNEVDRAALQKEVEQLKSEINRIADSANFNGIKLLDGTWDTDAITKAQEAVDAAKQPVTADPVYGDPMSADDIKNLMLTLGGDGPNSAADVGTKTVLETETVKYQKPSFQVSLNGTSHVLKDTTQNADKITLTVNGQDIEIGEKDIADYFTTKGTTLKNGDTVTGAQLAEVIVDKIKNTAAGVGAATDIAAGAPAFGKQFGDGTNAWDVRAEGENLIFEFADNNTKPTTALNKHFDVALEGAANLKSDVAATKYSYETGAVTKATAPGTNGKITVNYTDADGKAQTAEVAYNSKGNLADAGAEAAAIVTELKKNADLAGLFNITSDAAGKIKFEALQGGETKTSVTGITVAAGGATGLAIDTTAANVTTVAGKDAYTTGTNGYVNKGTEVVIPGVPAESDQLASTTLDFTNMDITDGMKIKLGDEEYTFAVGPNSSIDPKGKNVIDLTSTTVDELKATGGDATKRAEAFSKLSEVAKDNKTFTVSHQGTDAKIGIKQKAEAKDTTDMTTMDKFASYIGVTTVDADKTAEAQEKADAEQAEKLAAAQKKLDEATAKGGKALNLQIGDTSDDYNQLGVKIGSMKTEALGIAELDISTAENAAEAIDTIKSAINHVSSVRGDLGAYQNRLDHTANNLSVMAENIQDAESTIRDTDVAEEMMSYVKNNILVQSAQAMLAQANQVPQGVLQLLG